LLSEGGIGGVSIDEVSRRSGAGENIDSDNIKQHKRDVFRLSTLLTAETRMSLPAKIQDNLRSYLDEMQKPPDLKASKSSSLLRMRPSQHHLLNDPYQGGVRRSVARQHRQAREGSRHHSREGIDVGTGANSPDTAP
jgi:hypothetical protein